MKITKKCTYFLISIEYPKDDHRKTVLQQFVGCSLTEFLQKS